MSRRGRQLSVVDSTDCQMRMVGVPNSTPHCSSFNIGDDVVVRPILDSDELVQSKVVIPVTESIQHRDRRRSHSEAVGSPTPLYVPPFDSVIPASAVVVQTKMRRPPNAGRALHRRLADNADNIWLHLFRLKNALMISMMDDRRLQQHSVTADFVQEPTAERHDFGQRR